MRLRQALVALTLGAGSLLATSVPAVAAGPSGSRLVLMRGLSPDEVTPATVRAMVVRAPERCVRVTQPIVGRSPAVDGKSVLRQSMLAPTRSSTDDEGQRWGRTILELFYFNMVGHAVRMIQEPVRKELKGPFFNDWLRAAKPIFADPHWYDDGPFSINYIGHPMAGAAYGMIQRQNNGRAREAIVGSPEYWRNVPRAMAVSALASLQYEIGPLSEASLGNIGLEPQKQGYIDLVVTPLLGTAWMIGEDAFDRYVTRKLEQSIRNKVARAAIRIATDLPRSMANATSRKAPWHRDDRPLGDR